MSKISETLQERKQGIILAHPNASLIGAGVKSLILRPKLFKTKVNKLFYLLEDSFCHGLIKLKYPDKINLTQFKELSSKHKIAEESRMKWWPHKEILYAYGFDIVVLFEEPKPVSIPIQTETFIQEFEFLEKIAIEELLTDQKPVIIEMKLDQPSLPLYPMNAAKIFHQSDKITTYMFEKSNKFAIEKKFKGVRVMLHKAGNNIKLYSHQKQDLSLDYPTIISEAKNLSNNNYIVDGIITNDQKLRLYLFDILRLGKEDLVNRAWYERNSKLHSLRFGNLIREVNCIITDSPSHSIKAIDLLCDMPDSIGVVIKRYDSKYLPDSTSDDWLIKINQATTTSTPGIGSVSGKKWKKKKIRGPKKFEDMTNKEKEEHLEAIKLLEEEKNANPKTD